MNRPIDVFIPCGSGDKLKHYFNLENKNRIKSKSLIELDGKRLLWFVVQALNGSMYVKSITIGGLKPNVDDYKFVKPVYFIEGGTTAFETYLKASKHFEKLNIELIMTVSSDIPLITTKMVDRAIKAIDLSQNIDLFFNVAWFSHVLKNYSDARKTEIIVKEGRICIGDFHIFNPKTFLRLQEQINKILKNRKAVINVLRILGIQFIIKYKRNHLTLKDMLIALQKLFNLRTAFWITEFPETVIDLDNNDDMPRFQKYIKTRPRKISNERCYLITAENYDKNKEFFPNSS